MALQPKREQTTLLQNLELEVVEVGDRVGFRPEPDTAGSEGLVTQIKDRRLIIEDLDSAAAGHHAQRVPSLDVDDLIEILQHMADAFHHSIDPDVLLEWICPREIVVSIVGRPPDESTAHVGFPLDGQEGHLKIEIRSDRSVDRNDFISVFGAFPHDLREHMRRTFGLVRLQHLPVACRTTIEHCADHEILWERSWGYGIEVQSRDGARCCGGG